MDATGVILATESANAPYCLPFHNCHPTHRPEQGGVLPNHVVGLVYSRCSELAPRSRAMAVDLRRLILPLVARIASTVVSVLGGEHIKLAVEPW